MFVGGYGLSGHAGLAHRIGVVPHGVADGARVAIVGTYQGFDQPVGWVQVFDNPP